MPPARRQDDEPTTDYRMRRSNGNGGPWWAQAALKAGLWAVLVFFLLGAIPGLPSPFFRLTAMERRLTAIEQSQNRTTAVLVLMCQGVWQGNALQQKACRMLGKTDSPEED